MADYEITTPDGKKYRVSMDGGESEGHKGNESTPGILGAGVDLLRGIGSGAISTGVGAYELARKIPGVGDALPPPSEYWKGAAEAPNSIPGKLGKFGEQAAEMGLSGSAVAAGASKLSAAARVAMQALTSGGVAGIQSGGDPVAATLAAGTEGVFSGAGAALTGSGVLKSISDFFKESALKKYHHAILRGGGSNEDKAIAAKSVPELIKRGETALSLGGMAEKAGEHVRSGGQAIQNAFDALPADSRIDVGAVANAIETASDKMFRNTLKTTGEMPFLGPEAVRGERHVKDVLDFLRQNAEVDATTGERYITAENARKLRQYYDKTAALGGAYSNKTFSDASTTAAHELAGNSMREELAKKFPDIAVLNKEYSFWKGIQQVTENTLQRKTGHGEGLGAVVAGVGGAVMGGAAGGSHGAVLLGSWARKNAEKIFKSTAWETVSSVQKDKLANALAKGNRGEAERIINNIGAFVTSATARNRKTEAEPEKE